MDEPVRNPLERLATLRGKTLLGPCAWLSLPSYAVQTTATAFLDRGVERQLRRER